MRYAPVDRYEKSADAILHRQYDAAAFDNTFEKMDSLSRR